MRLSAEDQQVVDFGIVAEAELVNYEFKTKKETRQFVKSFERLMRATLGDFTPEQAELMEEMKNSI